MGKKEEHMSKKKRRRMEIMSAHREGYRDAQEFMARRLDDINSDIKRIIVCSQLNQYRTTDDILEELEEVQSRLDKLCNVSSKVSRGSGRKTILDIMGGVPDDVRSITMDEQLKVSTKVVNRIIDRQFD